MLTVIPDMAFTPSRNMDDKGSNPNFLIDWTVISNSSVIQVRALGYRVANFAMLRSGTPQCRNILTLGKKLVSRLARRSDEVQQTAMANCWLESKMDVMSKWKLGLSHFSKLDIRKSGDEEMSSVSPLPETPTSARKKSSLGIIMRSGLIERSYGDRLMSSAIWVSAKP